MLINKYIPGIFFECPLNVRSVPGAGHTKMYQGPAFMAFTFS